MAFMGSCFAGAMASSHAFFSFRVSISSGVGAFRTAVLDDACARSLRLREAVKPGGSGMEAFLGLFEGVELRSSTHWGGEGLDLDMVKRSKGSGYDARLWDGVRLRRL